MKKNIVYLINHSSDNINKKRFPSNLGNPKNLNKIVVQTAKRLFLHKPHCIIPYFQKIHAVG